MDRTLRIAALDAGFFANVNNVVSVLGSCLGQKGFNSARVDWTVRPNMFHFTYGDVGTEVWGRFFEPLPFEPKTGPETDAPVFPDYSLTDVYAYRLYKRDLSWRRANHETYRRFVRPLPHIVQAVEEFAAANFRGHPVIAVHARHHGHSVENIFDIPPASLFIAKARRLASISPDTRVFLATDNAATASAFEDAFGDRLVMQSGVERASDQRQIHQGATASESRGMQVLVDALLLARCDAMLHVTSNIATAVGYINPALPMHFCETRRQAALGSALAMTMRVRAVGHAVRAFRARSHSRR